MLTSNIALEYHGGTTNTVIIVKQQDKSYRSLFYTAISNSQLTQTTIPSSTPALDFLCLCNNQSYANQHQHNNTIQPQSYYYTPNKDTPIYSTISHPYPIRPIRGIRRSSSRGKIVCQVCNKLGHMALQCYHLSRHSSSYNTHNAIS